MATMTIKIDDIATELGLQKEKVTLPNGKEIMSLVWKPTHLTDVFRLCDAKRAQSGLGRNDVVVIDGVCPTWLLPTVTHAFHPCQTAVAYPQGGPDVTLPISGVQIEGSGSGQDITLKVTETEEATTVEYSLSAPQVDALAVLKSLVAPEVSMGKSVRITGRGPIAIAAALAEAYAHRVPTVAAFQPGTGFVVCISHDANRPLGQVS
jgi:CRISPR-associated Csx3 family protein